MYFSFNKKIIVFILLSFFLCSCEYIAFNNLSLSGEIVHKKGEPHTYQGDFVFTSESYAVVRLRQSQGTAPSVFLKEQVIRDISSFPIKFNLQLDSPLDFSKAFSYFVSAQVFSQGGEELRVGDLATESVNQLRANQTFITLSATGLESCESEDSGGFCSDLH